MLMYLVSPSSAIFHLPNVTSSGFGCRHVVARDAVGCSGAAVHGQPPLALRPACAQCRRARTVERHVRVLRPAHAALCRRRELGDARHTRRRTCDGVRGTCLSACRAWRALLRQHLPVRLGTGTGRKARETQAAPLGTPQQVACRVPQPALGSAHGTDAHGHLDGMGGLRAVHGVRLQFGFGVGSSGGSGVPRPVGMGSSSLLPFCMSHGRIDKDLEQQKRTLCRTNR